MRHEMWHEVQRLNDQFIVKLAQRSPQALRYYLRGWLYPSESDLEEAHNLTVVDWAHEVQTALTNDVVDPLAVLVALQRIQPATQKTRYPERSPGWIEANEAWQQLWNAVLDAICYHPLVPLLTDGIQRAINRRIALTRYPSAEIIAVTGDVRVILKREEPRDRWWLRVEDHSGTYRHRVYLRAGHLSPRALQLRTALYYAADGTPVLAVIVDHAEGRGCSTYQCPLPAACEAVRQDGAWQFSLWRQNVWVSEAMLPMVGNIVRMGDVTLFTQMFAPDNVSDSYPGWLQRVNCVGAEYYGMRQNRAYFRITDSEVIFSHPDHYAVRILNEEHDRFVVCEQVHGRTQYIPSTVVTD